MATQAELQGYDNTQVKLMEEECIVLDTNDTPLRGASKYECHLVKNIEEGLLHRAFSVFLFDTTGRLLLQQRAGAKITYPLYWTNTCCSHPLYVPSELATSPDDIALGAKVAAVRKLEHELGITDIKVEDLTFLTRIQYKSLFDAQWGEHEIDYILVAQKDVAVKPEPNEVADAKYYSVEELETLVNTLNETGLLITPWFKLIKDNHLMEWWKNLGPNLKTFQDNTIHRY